MPLKEFDAIMYKAECNKIYKTQVSKEKRLPFYNVSNLCESLLNISKKCLHMETHDGSFY